MTNQKLITDDELEQIKNHFRKNKDYYAVGGIMLVTGVLMGKKMRKPVQIDKAAIFNDFLTEKAKQGYSIYALNTRQHNMWQSLNDWIETLAEVDGTDPKQTIDILTRQFRDSVDIVRSGR